MVLDNKKRAEMIRKQASVKKDKNTETVQEIVKRHIEEAKKEAVHVKLFLKKSTKPDYKEYTQLLRAHMTGVLLLGFLGYIITFVHIPINNILFGVKR